MKKIFQPSYLVAIGILLSVMTVCSCSKTDVDNDDNDDDNTALVELGDVTGKVVLLGNPLTEKYKDGTKSVYARNIWDMHAFDNKIYFGSGNSSNEGPAPNSGPAVLWSYDVAKKDFVKEFTTIDEQIHLIREFDNELYIPGHDSRGPGGWSIGNFYRLEGNEWKTYNTIPNAIHVYDIHKWEGKLFAAIGPQAQDKSIQISADGGQTWKGATNAISRIYSLYVIDNKLWTSNGITVYSKETDFFSMPSPTVSTSVLGARIERAVVFDGQTVFISGKTDNDHQYLPIDLRCASDIYTVNTLNLPQDALPRDILVKNKQLYVLISVKVDNNTYRNAVLGASALSSTVEWTELFHFTGESFARSFEYLNGVFYFGLGCETDILAPVTGNILSFNFTGQ